jgi:prolycopene isomerase
VTLMRLVPYDEYSKVTVQELLLAQAEKALPGLADHVDFSVGASPQTMEKFTLNNVGAVYGWEVSPEQTGANRLGHRTPIDGLYLSGHWTQPGGGLMPVIVSGTQTAQLISDSPSVLDFLYGLEQELGLAKTA